MKNKIFIIILGLLTLPTVALASWWNPFTPRIDSPTLGAANPPLNSSQVGSTPVNGYYLKTDGSISSWQPVTGGSGSGGGTWATTTSQVAGQLINYPLNTTDIVCIGGTATTTCKYWFDPNAQIASLAGLTNITNLLVTGSTTLQNFTARNATTTNATSTTLFSSVLSAGTVCLTGDVCRTTWPTGTLADWNKQTNYGVLTLTPTTTIPVWFKDQIFASSTAIFDSTVAIGTSTGSGAKVTIVGAGSTTNKNLLLTNLAGTPKVFIQDNGAIGMGTTTVFSNDSLTLYGTVPSDGRVTRISNAGGLVNFKFNDNSAASAISLENTQAAANLGVGVRFNLGYGGNQNLYGTSVAGADITAAQDGTWTSTASTEDSYLKFSTSLDGVLGEKLRISSGGTFEVGSTTLTSLYKIISAGDVYVGGNIVSTSTYASIFPYASTTAMSAGTICLTGDTCRTTWPSGSGTNFFTQTGNLLQNNTGTSLGMNTAPNIAALEAAATTSDATSSGLAIWKASGVSILNARADGLVSILGTASSSVVVASDPLATSTVYGTFALGDLTGTNSNSQYIQRNTQNKTLLQNIIDFGGTSRWSMTNAGSVTMSSNSTLNGGSASYVNGSTFSNSNNAASTALIANVISSGNGFPFIVTKTSTGVIAIINRNGQGLFGGSTTTPYVILGAVGTTTNNGIASTTLGVFPALGQTGDAFVVASSTSATAWVNQFTIKSNGQHVFNAAPNTAVAGTGAGTGPTLAITGDTNGGLLSVTTGTVPSGTAATIATITYPTACPADSSVTYSPADPDAAALSGSGSVYIDGTNTGFTLVSGITALVGSTNYLWNYEVHCW